MRRPPGRRSFKFVFSAAGFIATSTSGASPGVNTWCDEKLIWNPDTPYSVPAGARISAGKSGNVERSLPTMAAVVVNCEPVTCMPSPESPQKRTTAPSMCFKPVWGPVEPVVPGSCCVAILGQAFLVSPPAGRAGARFPSAKGRFGVAAHCPRLRALSRHRRCLVERTARQDNAAQRMGLRRVSFEQAAEPRCRGFDLLFRGGSQLVVGRLHDCAGRARCFSVGDGEESVRHSSCVGL